MAAMQEITNRGETCDKWAGMIAEDNARRRIAYAISQQQWRALINSSRPKQSSSQQVGDTLQTKCLQSAYTKPSRNKKGLGR